MMSLLTLKQMSKMDAQHICSWQYEQPYDVYNWPSWQEMCSQDMEFADDSIREQQYRSLYIGEELAGYIQLFPILQVIRLAIFLSPQHCNQGLGQYAVGLAIEAAQKLKAAEIDLEVERWNKRAIACYEKAGFAIADQYSYRQRGSYKDVYCMVYHG